MGDHTPTDPEVWPSDNDIGPADGDGDGLYEPQMSHWLSHAVEQNFVVSGLTVPATDPNLDIDVALGDAIIEGRYVHLPAATAVTVTNNDTNYLYLKLNITAEKTISVELEVNITGTAPSDSIWLAEIVAAGGSITSTVDKRPTKPYACAGGRMTVYTASGNFTAKTSYVTVEMIGAGGGGGGSDGGGGGGGGWTKMEVAVSPGTVYTAVVGAAGAAGLVGADGGDGGDSYFSVAGNAAPGGLGGVTAGAGGVGGGGTTTSSKLCATGEAGTAGSAGAGGEAAGYKKPATSYGDGGAGGGAAAVGIIGQAGLVLVYD